MTRNRLSRPRPPLGFRVFMGLLIFAFGVTFAALSVLIFWLIFNFVTDYEIPAIVLWAIAWVEQGVFSRILRSEAEKEGLL